MDLWTRRLTMECVESIDVLYAVAATGTLFHDALFGREIEDHALPREGQ